jgi:hypothetical protein
VVFVCAIAQPDPEATSAARLATAVIKCRVRIASSRRIALIFWLDRMVAISVGCRKADLLSNAAKHATDLLNHLATRPAQDDGCSVLVREDLDYPFDFNVSDHPRNASKQPDKRGRLQ